MARMIPECCPPSTASRAERELFEALHHRLDRHYTVIHSLPWLADDQRHLGEGECDFLILHPEHGMLALEVKSGEVRYDGKSRSWIQGESHVIDDPVMQAERSAHELNRKLCGRLTAWRQAGVTFGHALALPDADRLRGNFPSHVRPEILILQPDLERLAERIPEILGHYRRQPAKIDASLIQQAVEVLLPSFSVIRSLSRQLEDQEAELVRLTEQQRAFFVGLECNRRLVVEGVAGSGKTVLAKEAAVRLASQGHRVLLLCFNIPLAEILRQSLAGCAPQVDVFHFHGLCEHVVNATGGRFQVPSGDVESFYNEGAAELLIEKLSGYPARYDAVIVDEAQDFPDLWWVPIEEMLEDRGEGYLYLFLDRKQDIFRRHGNLPFDGPRFTLGTNCRNTSEIARLVHRVGQVTADIPSWVPQGFEPEFMAVESAAEERDAVRRLLHRLVNEQGLRTDQIVILGARRFEHSAFSGHPKLGHFEVVDRLDGCGPTEIRYGTFRRFKGLEAECVILTGIGHGGWSSEEALLREELYVAASRAKMLLYVFHAPGARIVDLGR